MQSATSKLSPDRSAVGYASCVRQTQDCDAKLLPDTLAEWLRRWPAKPLCSARVGSNPTGVVFVFTCLPVRRLRARSAKQYSHRGSNSEPFACEANVITIRPCKLALHSGPVRMPVEISQSTSMESGSSRSTGVPNRTLCTPIASKAMEREPPQHMGAPVCAR